jgi:hypothetical protein
MGDEVKIHFQASNMWPLTEKLGVVPLRELLIVSQYKFVPRLAFEDYLKDIKFNFKQQIVTSAKKKANEYRAANPQSPLNADQVTMIAMYTAENNCGSDNFYSQLNLAVRTRGNLLIWMDAIYLLDQALRLLPGEAREVKRGVSFAADLSKYKAGHVVVWSQFSSTSADSQVASTFSHSGGTLYSLKLKGGRDISEISLVPAEQELLLPLATEFIVEEVSGNHIQLRQIDTSPVFGAFRRLPGTHGAQSLDVWNLLRSAAFHAILFAASPDPELKAFADEMWGLLEHLVRTSLQLKSATWETELKTMNPYRHVAAQVLAWTFVQNKQVDPGVIEEMACHPTEFFDPSLRVSAATIAAATAGAQGVFSVLQFASAGAIAGPRFEVKVHGYENVVCLKDIETEIKEALDAPRGNKSTPSSQLPPLVLLSQLRAESADPTVLRLPIFYNSLPLLCMVALAQIALPVKLKADPKSFMERIMAYFRSFFGGSTLEACAEVLYHERLEALCTRHFKAALGQSVAELEVLLEQGTRGDALEALFGGKNQSGTRIFVETARSLARCRQILLTHRLLLVMGSQKAGKSTFAIAMGLQGSSATMDENTRDVSAHSFGKFHIIDCPAANDKDQIRTGLGRLLAHTADAAIILLEARNSNQNDSISLLQMSAEICTTNRMAVAIILNRADELFDGLRKDLMKEEKKVVQEAEKESDGESEDEDVVRQREQDQQKRLNEATQKKFGLRMKTLTDELVHKCPTVAQFPLYVSSLYPPVDIKAWWCRQRFVSSFDTVKHQVPLTHALDDFRDKKLIYGPRGLAAVLAQMCKSLGPNIFEELDTPAAKARFKLTW